MTSRKYILENMTWLERYFYVYTVKFTSLVTISLMVLGSTFKLMAIEGGVIFISGNLIMLWVIVYIVWRQIDRRAVELLEEYEKELKK